MEELYFVTLAIDFDETISTDKYPKADPNLVIPSAIYSIKHLQKHPKVKTILWSCRDINSDVEAYTNMIKCCNTLGLKFDAINDNLEEYKKLGFKCRKIFANYYIDDLSMYRALPEMNTKISRKTDMFTFWKTLQTYIEENGVNAYVERLIKGMNKPIA